VFIFQIKVFIYVQLNVANLVYPKIRIWMELSERNKRRVEVLRDSGRFQYSYEIVSINA
jgi:hypothetical protein